MISVSAPFQFNSKLIPCEPGVYLFKDKRGRILYVGKAKNLRSRVRSYFSRSQKPVKTQRLVPKINEIDWIVVDNEVEALLLENKLVKRHMPKYNFNLKDAKTFAYIALSRETYPRILTTRKTSAKLESFGPYTDGYQRRELQRLVVKVFKLRVCRRFPKRACLNFHIGMCTAPCVNKVNKEEYAEQVEQARSFLKGNYMETREMLKKQMQFVSKMQKYERALELRNQIASIELLTHHQVVDGERRFDQDVIAFRRFGEKILAVQMGVRKGVLLGKKEYVLDFEPQVEKEFLKEFYIANKIPREILLNKPCWRDNTQKGVLEEYFSTLRRAPVRLTVPQEGDELLLVKIAEKNTKLSLDEDNAIVDLQISLNLPTLPRVIECFDVSNIGQEHIVSGMVRFSDGKLDKSSYRRFKIRTVMRQNDLASMNEAVSRRYRRLIREKAQLPDLVLVDGGPGQVTAARSALQSLGLQIPLIGLAKKHEEIFLPDETVPRRFDKNSRMMLLLRQIRDTAHNFSVRYHRKRRQMKMREEFNKC
ncbi:excinuclease ABC subunit UvrC [Candidatus Bathyarchaeota archaeon]|nr:excinuclease ABC subunit UvrC [Candidatus Bathyarchaeota archaeon]